LQQLNQFVIPKEKRQVQCCLWCSRRVHACITLYNPNMQINYRHIWMSHLWNWLKHATHWSHCWAPGSRNSP
jgi:hypothetical protein